MAGRSTSSPKSKASRRKKTDSRAAYFLSLELENVRCFGPRQSLDLSDGNGRPAKWTVLLGDNGVGKTTVLQMLAGSELNQETDSQPLFASIAFLDPRFSGLRIGTTFTGRHSAMYRGKSYEPARISVGISVGAELLDEISLGEVIDGSCKFEGRPSLDGGTGVTLSWSPPSTAWPEQLKCYGYGAGRWTGSTMLSQSLRNIGSESLFTDGVTLLNAEEWFLQADYIASKLSSQQKAVIEDRDKIKNLLIEILPDVSDIRIVVSESGSIGIGLEFRTHYGWVTFAGLSLGYRTFITWIVDLASQLLNRYPNSKNPLAEPAIVLVDEIDLHLHPKWQRQITSYLTERFPNTQFIVTAHSPLIVQSAVGANIAVLRREGDHVVIDNNPTSVQGWRIDQILTSDLFRLSSARPAAVDEWVEERDRILAKKRITKPDKEKLRQLEAKIGEIPAGETPRDMEAMRILRQAASHLDKAKNRSG